MHDASIAQPLDAIPGLDELADEIGAPSGSVTGIGLQGKSGRRYGLVDLMLAFVHHLDKAEARIAALLDQAYELGIELPPADAELDDWGDSAEGDLLDGDDL